MKTGSFRRPRLRLNASSYQELHRAILKRDRWHCQNCGTRANLQVHHIQSRSTLGEDVEQNPITVVCTMPSAPSFAKAHITVPPHSSTRYSRGSCLPNVPLPSKRSLGTTVAYLHESRVARRLRFEPGTIGVFDRDYADCDWFASLDADGCFLSHA